MHTFILFFFFAIFACQCHLKVSAEARHVVEIFNENHRIVKSLPSTEAGGQGPSSEALKTGVEYAQEGPNGSGIILESGDTVEASLSRKHSTKVHPSTTHPQHRSSGGKQYHKLSSGSIVYHRSAPKTVQLSARGSPGTVVYKAAGSELSGPVFSVPVHTSYVSAENGRLLTTGRNPSPVFAYASEVPETPANTIKLFTSGDYPKEFHFGTGKARPTINRYHWMPETAGAATFGFPGVASPFQDSGSFGSPGSAAGIGLGQLGPAGPGEFIFERVSTPTGEQRMIEHQPAQDTAGGGFVPAEFFRSLFEQSLNEKAPAATAFQHRHHEAHTATQFASARQSSLLNADHLAHHFGLKPQYAHLPTGKGVHYSGHHHPVYGQQGEAHNPSGYFLAEESAHSDAKQPLSYRNRHKHLLAAANGSPASVGALQRMYISKGRLNAPENVEEMMKAAFSHQVGKRSLPEEGSSSLSPNVRVAKELLGSENEVGRPWGSRTTVTYADPKDPVKGYVQVQQYQMHLNRPLSPEEMASSEIGKLFENYQRHSSSASPEGEVVSQAEPPIEVYDDKKKK